MKPFNLEEAKAGKPVVTGNGLPVRFLCFDREHHKYPILTLFRLKNSTEDTVGYYTAEGIYYMQASYEKDSLNLFMKSEKKTGWVNVYCMLSKDSPKRECGDVFASEEEAKACGKDITYYVTSTKIEWEE